ncbi:hypothetical protein BP5796_01536 [Coleophoma crateriformis]|uniref:Atos-like conserved domain-containing protein n=1 Tax=Coleophoma crateriformis TaxID=565419 RepID=A0A3D8T0P2_9HELO|nr:hypothetical protein BP5796_01536 [Coleophoma crateriformis]
MPIFQDDLGGGRELQPKEVSTSSPPFPDPELRRKASEESIRTDLCEGPIPDSPVRQTASPLNSADPFVFSLPSRVDRVELIQRLKQGDSPSWLQNGNAFEQHTPVRKKSPGNSKSSPLLPAAEFAETKRPSTSDRERLQAGLEIERPRSALHTGDFTEARQESTSERSILDSGDYYNSEPQRWLSTSPPREYNRFPEGARFPSVESLAPDLTRRYRAPSMSSSYSSSFIYKPPTSPLVQSESNEDLELSSFMNPIDITQNSRHISRRHTMLASQSVSSTPSVPGSSIPGRALPHLRRDHTYPYQAHQPRRSLTLNPPSLFPSPSPQTPAFLRSRRPSFASDNSPLHHASMVGSYEESILRGRMSTTPSKPLDFVAQIGVLGLVFYSYETTIHGRIGKSEDGPSPYVGQIDLEGGLPNLDEGRDSKRKRHDKIVDRNALEDIDMIDASAPHLASEKESRLAEKQKRRSSSPRAPPGGSYRIPEKGQLQIIIKNPNKTAVKLFLVPYDLVGMEPGTKTFIRQRSYSAGPTIDSAISSTAQKPTSNSYERPVLRYLVHIHICCTGRSRFYLYKSIRVVFANRVPDGKEKLQNEISIPEPRFSIYKPGRESGVGFGTSFGVGATLAAEKAFRRRSYGLPFTAPHHKYDVMDGINQTLEKGLGGASGYEHGGDTRNHPVEPIPFQGSRTSQRGEDMSGQDQPINQLFSPTSSRSSRPPTSQGPVLSMSWNSNSSGISGYDKLSKGDVGYGGSAFSSSPDGKQVVAESLLAKKLRRLGVGLCNPKDCLDGA